MDPVKTDSAEKHLMPRGEEAPSMIRALMPGGPIFLVGIAVWLATAGFMFFLALPLMFVGSFLLVFGFLISKHASADAKYLSGAAALCSVLVLVWILW